MSHALISSSSDMRESSLSPRWDATEYSSSTVCRTVALNRSSLPFVALVEGTGGDTCALADGFQGRLLKTLLQEFFPGALDIAAVNGMVRYCHDRASFLYMENN